MPSLCWNCRVKLESEQQLPRHNNEVQTLAPWSDTNKHRHPMKPSPRCKTHGQRNSSQDASLETNSGNGLYSTSIFISTLRSISYEPSVFRLLGHDDGVKNKTNAPPAQRLVFASTRDLMAERLRVDLWTYTVNVKFRRRNHILVLHTAYCCGVLCNMYRVYEQRAGPRQDDCAISMRCSKWKQLPGSIPRIRKSLGLELERCFVSKDFHRADHLAILCHR